MSKLSFSVLRLRDFRLLLFTRAFSVMALQCQAVIVGWQIYSLSKSVFLLGLTGLVEAVPAISCALFAGHIVDVSVPKKVAVACIGALTLNTLMLFLFAGGWIAIPGGHLLWLIYVGIFISGAARSFIMPASFSLLPQIVPRAEIPAAAAWQSSVFQVAQIAGPALAGLVYGGYGAHGAWALPMSFMAISMSLLTFLKTPLNVPRNAPREPAAESIKAGLKFILNSPVLLSVMSLDMFAVLFGGAVAMLPAYADQVLHIGPNGLGLLRASPALGAVLMAVFLAVRPMQKLSARRLLFMVAGFGCCMIGFGLSHYLWLSMAFLALSGCFDSVSMVIRSTLMQLLTPDHMRGRVSSVNSMFIISSNEIGSFESGTAARLLGLIPSVVFGGVMTLGVVGLTAWLSPRFRRIVVDVNNVEASTIPAASSTT